MKKFIIFLTVIILTSLIVNGCKRLENNELRFVEYIKIAPERPDNKKEFFGYIKAGGEVELAFETVGTIERIFFQDGDSVKRGQVIATLDNELNELEEREMYAALQEAYVRYRNAKSYYERIDKLHAVGGISDNDWDKARTEMESMQQGIEMSKERLLSSKKKAGYGKLIAPADGIILKKVMEEGGYANPGQAVVLFQDDRNSEAKIFVSEKYINKLHNGMEVLIKAEGVVKEPLKAKIKHITKTSIEEGAYRATVEFDKKYPDLKDGIGIQAFIEFDNRDEKDVIQVPITSVIEDEISSYVWVITNLKESGGIRTGKLKKQEVVVVEIRNNMAIIEGVRRNDLVVSRGAGEVMEGQKVKIKEDTDIKSK